MHARGRPVGLRHRSIAEGTSDMYDPAHFRLDDRVAVITGGGAGIALTFAGAGAAVVVSDLDADAAAGVAREIGDGGGRATSTACDVTDETQLQALVARAVDDFGRLTTVVGNAGGGDPKPFDMPMRDFRFAFELNVFSLFRLAQLAAPELEKAGGGAILATTSMAGENRNERMASCGASKASANHLIRNLAFDLGPRGVRINGVAPGAARTAALESVLTDEIEAKMLEHTPVHRLGESSDIANAALFPCSSAASWISGQIVTVSGGGVQELG